MRSAIRSDDVQAPYWLATVMMLVAAGLVAGLKQEWREA